MIAVIFRWEIKPEYEQSFTECWSEITQLNIEKHGALGSRLHKAKNNQLVSYSQWISEEHFNNAFAAFNAIDTDDKHQAARVKMHQAIAKSFEPIIMVPVLDHLMATELTQPHLLP